MKVLVTDDDPDQVIIRCMLLAHHGYETRRAGDAETALRIANEEKPDIAVVDLRLPTEEDGLYLIRELKSAVPEIGIIILTGTRPEQLKGRPGFEYADSIIEKGHSSSGLLESIKQLATERTVTACRHALSALSPG